MNITQNTIQFSSLSKLNDNLVKQNFYEKSLSTDKIKTVAKEFEGMFLSQMFGHMFKGLKTNGLMGGGNGEAIFRDLLIREYGKIASKAGGIGLAKSIERQLSTFQEVKND